MPSQQQLGVMASGLAVDCSHGLLFRPSPSCCGAAWKPAPPVRLWKEPSRRSGCTKSLVALQAHRLCITACYAAVPAPSEILPNGALKENGSVLTPSPLSAATNGSRAVTSEAAGSSQSEGGGEGLNFPDVMEKSNSVEGVDRFNLPEVTESFFTLENRADQASSLDSELQGIITNIADVEKLNEMLGEKMKNIQELLGTTARSLNAKAQEAKIEAAKLKKLAKLNQIDEIRRAESMRRSIIEARMKMARSSAPVSDKLVDTGGSKGPQTASSDGHGSEVPLEEISGSEDQAQSSLIAFPDIAEDDRSVRSESLISRVESMETQLGRVESHQNAEDSSLFGGEEGDISGPAAVIFESEECIVTHPGALSCTKTVIKSDPSKKSAVVSMETTVTCDGDAYMVKSLAGEDYIALGVQALSEAVQELKKVQFSKASDPDPVLHKKHANILDLLEDGRVVKAKPMEPPSKFGHESFVIELQNKQTEEKLGLDPNPIDCWSSGQIKIEAMFKPGIEGNADGWHRAPIEMVAYKLNLMLGMDYVPPAIYKSGGVDVNYKHYHDGAFVYFVPSTKHLRRVPATKWGVSVALLLSDTRILDVLLNNSDRHHGHFLFGEHWADGKMKPVLIDHAAGFRKEAVVKMDDENAFKTGPVRCVSAKTYLRLRFLEKEIVASTFEGLLSATEVTELMQRRDMILSYLDNLVKERGYYRTVIEA